MSHVVTISVEFKDDPKAMAAACERLGWTFEQASTYHWYGKWVNDYHGSDAAYKNGIAPEDYGKCDYRISVPGADYQIGLVRRGGKLVPIWDNYSPGGLRGLNAENGIGGLVQAYAVEKAKAELRRKGYTVTERAEANGKIQLVGTL